MYIQSAQRQGQKQTLQGTRRRGGPLTCGGGCRNPADLPTETRRAFRGLSHEDTGDGMGLRRGRGAQVSGQTEHRGACGARSAASGTRGARATRAAGPGDDRPGPYEPQAAQGRAEPGLRCGHPTRSRRRMPSRALAGVSRGLAGVSRGLTGISRDLRGCTVMKGSHTKRAVACPGWRRSPVPDSSARIVLPTPSIKQSTVFTVASYPPPLMMPHPRGQIKGSTEPQRLCRGAPTQPEPQWRQTGGHT